MKLLLTFLTITLFSFGASAKYNFKLKDLLSCWKLALLNTQGLFSKPFEVKNPYTNIPIKNNNLYNIYFKCLNMYVKSMKI